MTSYTWTNGVGGTFENAANWTPTGTPGAGDDALLTATGTYIVTTTKTDTVADVQTASGATLSVSAGFNFTMTGGTGAGVNAGQILVGAGSSLYLGGTFDNTSSVASGGLVLVGGASAGVLQVLASGLTLTGGGDVVLGGAGNDVIVGATASGNTLINANNTLSGAGDIGNGQMTLVNQTAGLIDANQTAALELWANGGVINTGELEASGAGGLLINATIVDNEGNANAGAITATVSGAHVDLSGGSVISGGTLSAVAGAWIDVAASQTATLNGADPGAPVNITTGSTLDVDSGATIYISGSIGNAGVIDLVGSSSVRLSTPLTTLSGAGHLVLAGASDTIYGAASSADGLVNVNNTISGAGAIGSDLTGLQLVNQTRGVIDANQTSQLTLDASQGVLNTGLLEATNTGGLLILDSSVDNTQGAGTLVNTGKITAIGAGAHVDLQGSTLDGGTLTTSGGGYIDVLSGSAATLDGAYSGAPVVITAGSAVDINNNAALTLTGTIYNSGVINLGVPAEANNTEIRISGPVTTLTTATPTVAGGIVQLSNSGNNIIYGVDGSAETLDNVNNTIQGSGAIGAGQMTLINGALGVIDANQAPNGAGQPGVLTLDVNGGVANSGLIESSVASGATAGGTLVITSTTINNGATGKIEANGAGAVGSTIELRGAVIQGGLLSSTRKTSSLFDVAAGQTATLDGRAGAVTLSGVFNVDNNGAAYLQGAVSVTKGTGSVNILATANNTYLWIDSATVTLSGGGIINMGGANSVIQSVGAGDSLINAGVTIEGAGYFGDDGPLAVINQSTGVIKSTSATAALMIGLETTMENAGLLESVAAGGLLIQNSNIDNTYASATGVLNGGRIIATGAGHIDLQNANIYGGTLSTAGAAWFDVVSGSAAGFDGAVLGQALTIAGNTPVNILNGAALYLIGAIHNFGTLNLEGTSGAWLELDSSTVVLSGTGHVVLGGSGANTIAEAAVNCRLDNVGNTISGSGAIGAGGTMSLTNESAGTIDATTGGITINLGGVQMVNAGTLEATTGALTLTGPLFNTGTVIANGANVVIGGNINGAGNLEIFGASKLEIGGSTGGAAAQTVTFEAGSAGIFRIDNAQNFSGAVAGLATGETLDLANVASGTASLTYSGTTAGGVLTVTSGAVVATIHLTGNYTQANFGLASDGGSGTDITYAGTGLAAAPPAAAFVAAMASIGTSAAVSYANAAVQGEAFRPTLLGPRPAIA